MIILSVEWSIWTKGYFFNILSPIALSGFGLTILSNPFLYNLPWYNIPKHLGQFCIPHKVYKLSLLSLVIFEIVWITNKGWIPLVISSLVIIASAPSKIALETSALVGWRLSTIDNTNWAAIKTGLLY